LIQSELDAGLPLLQGSHPEIVHIRGEMDDVIDRGKVQLKKRNA